ncbi:hypothetical protein [Roseimaritima sediminicola]|uniref:hypothetical protein n=1 Tax=Roseimaritima sediminicola TaxID=2662066 RepID=UPI0012984C26|nr:hypothetical protein [Roseimaritima sediminicola]
MSSSPREAAPCDAVVRRAADQVHDETDAPFRLPEDDQAEFVRQFNETYRSLGLYLIPRAREAQRPPDGTAS